MIPPNSVNPTNLPSEKEDLQRLGPRIVERRRTRGWKQRELARRVEIEPGRLSRIERGIARPQLEELARLKTAFGGSVDELLFGEAPVGTDASLDQLARDIDRLASREEVAILLRLFHLLVLGYRSNRRSEAQPGKGDRE